MNQYAGTELHFVCCVSNQAVFTNRLAASPCIRSGQWGLSVHRGATSAAQGFNATMDALQGTGTQWLIWVHQDVYLPPGWDAQFLQSLAEAQVTFDSVAVAGVYGLRGAGAEAVRAGRVLDRGVLLEEPALLPLEADSLDELLFAVRVDTALALDAAMGFDFYATDLVLEAKARGLRSVVIDAFCEHWAGTPKSGRMPAELAVRLQRSGAAFEHKWMARLPVTTPCFDIGAPGDVARTIKGIYGVQ